MKKLIHRLIVLLLIGFSLNFGAQILVNNNDRIEKSIEDGKYKYCNATCDVIVEFKNNIYVEYYPNNEFIKASIKWLSNDHYRLTIVDIQKEGLPFGVGTTMKTKIVRRKGDFIFYESELQGLTWSGKFERIIDDTSTF